MRGAAKNGGVNHPRRIHAVDWTTCRPNSGVLPVREASGGGSPVAESGRSGGSQATALRPRPGPEPVVADPTPHGRGVTASSGGERAPARSAPPHTPFKTEVYGDRCLRVAVDSPRPPDRIGSGEKGSLFREVRRFRGFSIAFSEWLPPGTAALRTSLLRAYLDRADRADREVGACRGRSAGSRRRPGGVRPSPNPLPRNRVEPVVATRRQWVLGHTGSTPDRHVDTASMWRPDDPGTGIASLTPQQQAPRGETRASKEEMAR